MLKSIYKYLIACTLLGTATSVLSDESKQLLVISGLCSSTPDPKACIQGAASEFTNKDLLSVATSCFDTSHPLDCLEGALLAIDSEKRNKQLQLFSNDFKSLTVTKRKQLQYALRELGFYNKGIDGIWGSGTGSALLQFASKNNYVDIEPTTIMNEVISRVDVPKSFASTRKVVKQPEAKKDECKSIASELLGIPLCVKNPPPLRIPTYESVDPVIVQPVSPIQDNLNQDRLSNGGSNTCSSDYNCGIGERCVKKLGRGRGICMREVNSSGIKSYDKNTGNFGVRSYDQAECNFNTDCPTRFKCDRTYKVCVKR